MSERERVFKFLKKLFSLVKRESIDFLFTDVRRIIGISDTEEKTKEKFSWKDFTDKEWLKTPEGRKMMEEAHDTVMKKKLNKEKEKA